jgi:hypothetical protein
MIITSPSTSTVGRLPIRPIILLPKGLVQIHALEDSGDILSTNHQWLRDVSPERRLDFDQSGPLWTEQQHLRTITMKTYQIDELYIQCTISKMEETHTNPQFQYKQASNTIQPYCTPTSKYIQASSPSQKCLPPQTSKSSLSVVAQWD